jgi:hypothetical protein
MRFDRPSNHIQLSGSETVVAGEPERPAENLQVLFSRSTYVRWLSPWLDSAATSVSLALSSTSATIESKRPFTGSVSNEGLQSKSFAKTAVAARGVMS